MSQFCQSCAAPLDMPDMKGVSDKYCKYCSDESGNLKSRQEVRQGVAYWFAEWQNVSPEVALARADHYLRSMPAWAED